MNEYHIKLGELAVACYIYKILTKNIKNKEPYEQFQQATGNSPDLSDKKHIKALLEFLNKWGCRIAGDALPKISEQLKSWYKEYNDKLPRKNLWSLCDSDLDSVIKAYKGLKKIKRIGPTTASKILFALRPEALVAWDNKIREETVGLGPEGSYKEFLKLMQRKLETMCKENNFKPEQFLDKLKSEKLVEIKNGDTVPKVIDEYNWITRTKGCNPPDKETLRRWDKWTKS